MPTRAVAATAGWAALVAVAIAWGAASVVDAGLAVNAAPLTGRWRWHPAPGLLVAVAVGSAAVVAGPGLARRLAWRPLLVVTAAAASGWAVVLAGADGWDRVTAPLATRYEYEALASTIRDPAAFLRTFVDRLDGYPTHVRGHPPVATLVPWALDRLSLGGAGWFAAVCIAAWGVAAAAVLAAARAVAGEETARRAAPAVAFVPAAVWAATSADALFAGTTAVAAAAVVVATVRRRLAPAVAGGALFGGALLLTYGAVPLAAVPVAVAAHRRAWRPVVVAGAAAAGVVVAAGAAGFWWPDGLAATRAEYWAGVASRRPSTYFATVGNPGALALATGPVVAAGLVARRSAGQVLPSAALAAVVLANVSLLSKGEVERIWLPFVPWLALSAGALGPSRWWLGAQVTLALVLQAWLVSPW